MKTLAYWISVFFGSGLSKKAPGTMGSLASLLIWAPFVMTHTSWWVRLCFVVAVFAIGLWAVHASWSCYQGEDPKEVVIDEVVGQGLTLLMCPPSFWWIAVGFVLFRVFDILKPWPVSFADQRIKGPLGVMLDDVLAGLYALVALWCAIGFVG